MLVPLLRQGTCAIAQNGHLSKHGEAVAVETRSHYVSHSVGPCIAIEAAQLIFQVDKQMLPRVGCHVPPFR